MKVIVLVVLALGCKKATSEPAPAAGSGSSAATAPAPAPEATGSTAPAADEPVADNGAKGEPGKGVTVKHQVPEMSGSYDTAFAQVDTADHQITLALVRGCAKLTCDPGPWEAEQVAHVCPKAFVATAKIASVDAGKYTVDVSFAGPMSNVSTATLEAVRIELTSVDVNAKISGTVSQKTSESSASGSFTAKVCPRT